MSTTFADQLAQLARFRSERSTALGRRASAFTQPASHVELASDLDRELDRCACEVALENRFGQAYNEEAFRFLLEIEQKRSNRSGRPFLLLLLDIGEDTHASVSMDATLAAKLFSALLRCLRETDLVGWFRDGRVAGAMLSQLADVRGTGISERISHRVGRALSERLPLSVSSHFEVRVHQLPSILEGRD